MTISRFPLAKNGLVRLDHNGLSIHCQCGPDGTLFKKCETFDREQTEYAYRFGPGGRLAEVAVDNDPTEEYAYDAHGRRVFQSTRTTGNDGWRLRYDASDRLVRAGGRSFAYDDRGRLAAMRELTTYGEETTRYYYGASSRLERVHLPDGSTITWYYEGEEVVPVSRSKNGVISMEYQWTGEPLARRLAGCRDYGRKLTYVFSYNSYGMLDRMSVATMSFTRFIKGGGGRNSASLLTEPQGLEPGFRAYFGNPRPERLEKLFARRAAPLELLCCCDQVGTLKIVTDTMGRPVKKLLYDSFGNVLWDNFPEFFIPVGFAGGLVDPDTGFTRFGFRDYDPLVGRFTAPDPLGDIGGDLYEYCAGDPVSCIDRSGLFTEANFSEAKVRRDENGRFSRMAGNAGKEEKKGEKEGKPEAAEIDHEFLAYGASGKKAKEQRPFALAASPLDTRNIRPPQGSNETYLVPASWTKPRYKPPTREQELAEFLSNVVASASNLAGDLAHVVANPEETAMALYCVSLGYIHQGRGIDSEYRRYSDAVTTYYAGRYGSWEAFEKACREDPVGVMADVSLVLTLGGGALRLAGKAASVAAKAGGTTRAAAAGAMAGSTLEKAGTAAGKAGNVLDPITLAGKAAAEVGKAGVKATPEAVRALVEVLMKKPGFAKALQTILESEPFTTLLARLKQAAAPTKTTAGMASTQQSIERSKSKQ